MPSSQEIDAAIERLIAVALGEVGYTEQGGPHGNDGNIVKYWPESGRGDLQGSYWCMDFLSWCCQRAGIKQDQVWVHCGLLGDFAKQHGCWDEDGNYRRGSFGTGGHGEHVWLILNDNGSVMETVEGNAQPGDGGNQANGGAVWHRTRSHGNWVDGAIDVRALLEKGIWGIGDAAPNVPSGGSSAPANNDSGMLRVGSRGPRVAEVQRILGGLDVDSDFGPKTEAAVKAFQAAHGLEVDGIVGDITWGALHNQGGPAPAPAPAASIPPFPGQVQRGSTGEAVRQFQQRLADRGWHIVVDSEFGPATEGIVRQFQAEKGLEVDGVAGVQTWNALWTTPIT